MISNLMALSYIQEQINQGKREINLGKLDPNRDFTNTSDMANAIYMLIQTFNSGIDVFNLGQGQEYSVMEIVEAFEHCLCEKKTVVQDPERIRKPDRMHCLADISKLKAFTGWEPQIGIIEGIRRLCCMNIFSLAECHCQSSKFFR